MWNVNTECPSSSNFSLGLSILPLLTLISFKLQVFLPSSLFLLSLISLSAPYYPSLSFKLLLKSSSKFNSSLKSNYCISNLRRINIFECNIYNVFIENEAEIWSKSSVGGSNVWLIFQKLSHFSKWHIDKVGNKGQSYIVSKGCTDWISSFLSFSEHRNVTETQREREDAQTG